MPRASGGKNEPTGPAGPRDRAGGRPQGSAAFLELDDDLREALMPWIDLSEVGAVGLRAWIHGILPVLPRPTPGGNPLDRDVSHGSMEERLTALAQSLSECASDRARAHFQASEYFRENRALARRLLALEAALRTSAGAGGDDPLVRDDPEARKAARRYLPSDRP